MSSNFQKNEAGWNEPGKQFYRWAHQGERFWEPGFVGHFSMKGPAFICLVILVELTRHFEDRYYSQVRSHIQFLKNDARQLIRDQYATIPDPDFNPTVY